MPADGALWRITRHNDASSFVHYQDYDVLAGRLKMRDMKMRHKEKRRKMQEWKIRHKKSWAGKCEKSQYGKRTDALCSIKWIIVYWHNKKQTRRAFFEQLSKKRKHRPKTLGLHICDPNFVYR